MADLSVLMPIVVGVGVTLLILLGLAGLFKAFYVKVEQGTALIVNDMSSKPKVHFTGALVYPIIYKKELMRISLITLEVDRRGKDGLICRDNMRADITVAFYLRVNETAEDVLKVAKSIGANRASDKIAVDQLFSAKFSEALKTVGKQIEFVQLFENRQEFREKIIEVIGDDLNGYVLEDVAIDYLEQTPKGALDASNILDAEGIKKITELTAAQNVRTNELERDEQLAIKKKDVTTVEAMLELERQQADAEARQQREILSIQAREEAETRKVQEEERRRAEQTHIQVVQDLSVQTENQKREVEVAEQNRQRAVAIEQEKVVRARDLEVVAREREVAVESVLAEKAVEVEKKEIANVIRERVAVDKTVAVEEERIKEVREVSEADRLKQTAVLAAEATAEEERIKEVVAAKATETAANHKAKEITTLAEARLAAAGKDSEAKKVLAEGVQAEEAAPGLAKADIVRATGTAEAEVIKETGTAEASAKTEVGMANAAITKAQFQAEADGLTDKFAAMAGMSGETREHEEFRMALETAFKEALASIEAGKEIAKENAEILSIALEKAHIDIVGGEEHFFDNFAKSLSIGKAVDGLADKSSVVKALLAKVATSGDNGAGTTSKS
ncbi:MAG: hypothetical protein AAFZ58_00145 [Pseudomonadota bacterium]